MKSFKYQLSDPALLTDTTQRSTIFVNIWSWSGQGSGTQLIILLITVFNELLDWQKLNISDRGWK